MSSRPLQNPETRSYAGSNDHEAAAADMALSLPRRRTPEARDGSGTDVDAPPCPLDRKQRAFPTTLVVLLLLLIWCSSMALSGSFFHICFSSRKLNLYCISGGAGRDFGVVQKGYVVTDDSLMAKNSSWTDQAAMGNAHEKEEVSHGRQEEISNAVKVVEEKLQVIRSWASGVGGKGCEGRGVFVYNLPDKFNTELMHQCHELLPWKDLCPYFSNDGMGEAIPALGTAWYKTHQYALEPIFHQRVLRHPCRVHNPDNARLFYVPFYGGLDILRWHFKNVSTEVKDALGVELLGWLEQQGPWARNRGKDHVFVLGKISWDFRRRRDDPWGSTFLDLPQMHYPFKFLIERHPWETNEIGIPHPTHFHPHSDEDILAWQSKIVTSPRKHLVSFAGAARPGDVDSIRSALIRQCESGRDHCEFLNCGGGGSQGCSEPEKVVGLFMESEFCMQPPGDSPTRKSVFDSMVAGCIPVLFDPFTAYYQYPWHLPEDHRRYSLFVDKEEVREGKVDVVERLRRVPAEEREEMRRYIVYELMPRLLYGDSNAQFHEFVDAFGVVMNNMLDLVTRPDSDTL